MVSGLEVVEGGICEGGGVEVQGGGAGSTREGGGVKVCGCERGSGHRGVLQGEEVEVKNNGGAMMKRRWRKKMETSETKEEGKRKTGRIKEEKK